MPKDISFKFINKKDSIKLFGVQLNPKWCG